MYCTFYSLLLFSYSLIVLTWPLYMYQRQWFSDWGQGRNRLFFAIILSINNTMTECMTGCHTLSAVKASEC